MSAQQPTDPGTARQPTDPGASGHVGPWILAAAVVLVLGALLAVVVHNEGQNDTQTVITRSPTVNTTSVQGTVTQATTTLTAPAAKTTTVTQPPKTTTVTQPPRTVTAPTVTATTP